MSLAARKFTHIPAADQLVAENDGTWGHDSVNGAVFATAGSNARRVSRLYQDMEFEDPPVSEA